MKYQMQTYQKEFIKFSLDCGALSFGDFTLKSGRQSPYFFNAGVFNTGKDLQQLGYFYANAIERANLTYDALFGPAYKGITLVTATAIALAAKGKNIPYAFNRKEAKDHGEHGQIVGANLANKKVLVIDDVITAGTATREAVHFLDAANAVCCGIIIALDRQERGQKTGSAIEEIAEHYHVPVNSIISMTDVIEYLQAEANDKVLAKKIKTIIVNNGN